MERRFTDYVGERFHLCVKLVLNGFLYRGFFLEKCVVINSIECRHKCGDVPTVFLDPNFCVCLVLFFFNLWF